MSVIRTSFEQTLPSGRCDWRERCDPPSYTPFCTGGLDVFVSDVDAIVHRAHFR